MGRAMFRIKICGVLRECDSEAVARAGGDAIGLNFHRPSIRYVQPQRAAELARHATSLGLAPIGVFVNDPPERIATISAAADLAMVQLHGDQTAQQASWLIDRGCRVLRAIRLPVGSLSIETIRQHLDPWLTLGCPLLLDADAGQAGGGQGLQLDWDSIGRWAITAAGGRGKPISWALAGGLDADTVAEAIRRSAAPAVDVASGVEQPRGTKSAERIGRFIGTALEALPVRRERGQDDAGRVS